MFFSDNITARDYLKLPENTQAIPDINLENVCQVTSTFLLK